MSVFDGEIDLNTTYKLDYPPPQRQFQPMVKAYCDNCLIVGVGRENLKSVPDQKNPPDVLCPLHLEYYKEQVKRMKKDHPKLAEKYLKKDIDPQPILNDIKDLKRSEYLYSYCDRDLPFISVNLARRARALQSLRLPDDVYIPITSQTASYRLNEPERYQNPKLFNLKPKPLSSAVKSELEKILRISTGISTYTFDHGLLGKVILEKNPFGPPRKEPKYGRWRTPFYYTYQM